MLTTVYRLVSVIIVISLVLSGYTSAQAVSDTASTSQFIFENRILSISTGKMDIKIENGVIIYIKDNASGEILVNGSSTQNRPSVTNGFIGFSSKSAVGNYYLRWPTAASTASFSLLQPNVGRLVYTVYFNSFLVPESKLIYDISVDPAGEVLIQVTGQEAASDLQPFSVDLPIMNSTTQSVILGSGAEYLRSDAAKNDQVSFPGYGLHSPAMAVIEGNRAVVGVWSEATLDWSENISLIHTPAYDHVVLHSEQHKAATNKQQIISPVWRLGTYPAWYEAARRWKNLFEIRTGAKPLWENPATWVRNIHAVFYATNAYYSQEPEKFAELAAVTSPQKTLYFEWNGDRIVLFGDHTLAKNITRPSVDEIKYVRQYGWPMILYHPYNLIHSPTGTTARLEKLRLNNWLPDNYQFSPDYGGTANQWFDYWSDVSANYWDGSSLYVLHPGSMKFKTYFMANLSHYLAKFEAKGAYLDISGAGDAFFNGMLIDGLDYTNGERDTFAQMRKNYPEIGLMSEYLSPWLLPYVFYTWEGTETHVRQNQYAQTKLNHPLRVALTGSYAWSQEDNTGDIDDINAALLGTLPQVSLVGDYNVSDQRAIWSEARARLFTEQELFNDLPLVWKEGVLAYYRSKNGNWFAYQPIGATYGYVEILPDGSEVIRLTKENLPVETITPAPTATITPSPTNVPDQSYSYILITPATVEINATAQVSVGLENIPADGYSGVEFACSYNANVIEAKDIDVTDIFGPDPAVAINGPQNGTLIVAVAGSHKNKSTSGGVVFTLTAKGLQVGQAPINCKTRVTRDDDNLEDLLFVGGSLTVIDAPLPTPQLVISTPQLLPLPSQESSANSKSPATAFLTGKVNTSKLATVDFYISDGTLVMSQVAHDGETFSLTVPPGVYSIMITSSGCLPAQGQVSFIAGQTFELPLVSLLAGDLDGNNQIDQFDALTIGMGYNTAFPEAADLNNDGLINLLDLKLLARNYRQVGPTSW